MKFLCEEGVLSSGLPLKFQNSRNFYSHEYDQAYIQICNGTAEESQ